MTQRIKKIIYKRPNVSLGNSTDAILPGGPLLPDFYIKTNISLFEAPQPEPEPISYVIWEWNEEDLSQFETESIIILSSSTITPNIPSASLSVESMEVLNSQQNSISTGGSQLYPVSNIADSGSVLNFHIFSGTRGGFFIPVRDIDPSIYREQGGFTVEMQIISRSNDNHGGADYPDLMQVSLVVGEIVNSSSVNGIAQNLSYNESVTGTTINKNRIGAAVNNMLSLVGKISPVYTSHEFRIFPSGSERSVHLNAGLSRYANNEHDIYLLDSFRDKINPTGDAYGFLSSSFNPNRFGVAFWSSTAYANSYNLYIRKLRIVKSIRARETYGTQYAPVVINQPQILTASYGPISGSTISLSNYDFRFYKWAYPSLGPYRETYRWFRNSSPITNATASTYKITDLDINQTIEGFVYASNSVGMGAASASLTPIFGLPSVSGSGLFGYFGTAENVSSSLGRVATLYDSMIPSGSRTFLQNTTSYRPFVTSSNGRTWMRMYSGSTGLQLQGSNNIGGFISASSYHGFIVFNMASASLDNANIWENHRICGDSSGYFGIFAQKQAENDYWAYLYHWDGSAKSIQFPINLNETYCMEFYFSSSVLGARINSSSFESSSSIGNVSSLGSLPYIGSNSTYQFWGDVGAILFAGNKLSDEDSQTMMEALSRSWGFSL